MLDDRVEWLVVAVLLVALAIMTAAVFIGTAHGAAATACRSVPDRADRAWWSWRRVEGKRCYYRGRPGRDRAALRWGKPVPEPELAAAAPVAAAPQAARPGAEPVMVVPDLPVVPVQQQLASYRIVQLAAPPLALPPLPYPRPKFLEPASPWWLLVLVGIMVALRMLVLAFPAVIRRVMPQ
jgi:hypothetical protein